MKKSKLIPALILLVLIVIIVASGIIIKRKKMVSSPLLDRPIRVAINVWPGVAGGVIANNGFYPNEDENCIFWKNYKLKVEFIIEENYELNRKLFLEGKCDMMWNTIDQFAYEYSTGLFQDVSAQAIIFNDWSIGGDGIAAINDITYVGKPLLNRKIAAPKFSPPHYLFIYLVNNSDLTATEKQKVKNSVINVRNAKSAADMFQNGEVDVAITWEPDLARCVNNRGGHKLATTKEAKELIADLIVARKDFIDEYPDIALNFIAGWFEGVKKFYEDQKNAMNILERAYAPVMQDTRSTLERILKEEIRLTGYNDNIKFFRGKENERCRYNQLFDQASSDWREEGVTNKVINSEITRNIKLIEMLESRFDNTLFKYELPEEIVELDAMQETVLKTNKQINFPSGSYEIPSDQIQILDDYYQQIMKVFTDSKFSVIGHTDNMGNAEMNKELSRLRVQSVVDYFVDIKGESRGKFVIEGRGEENPIASNETAEGRRKNRRIELIVFK